MCAWSVPRTGHGDRGGRGSGCRNLRGEVRSSSCWRRSGRRPTGNRAARRPDRRTAARPLTVTLDMPGVTPDCTACAHGACSELSVQGREGTYPHRSRHRAGGVGTAQRNGLLYRRPVLYPCGGGMPLCGLPPDAPADRAGEFHAERFLPLSEAGIDPAAQTVDIWHPPSRKQSAAAKEEPYCPAPAASSSCSARQASGAPPRSCAPSAMSATCRSARTRNSRPLTAPSRLSPAAPAWTASASGWMPSLPYRSATAPLSLHLLAGVTFGADVPRRRGEYVICFPAPSDTLWSVAKALPRTPDRPCRRQRPACRRFPPTMRDRSRGSAT